MSKVLRKGNSVPTVEDRISKKFADLRAKSEENPLHHSITANSVDKAVRSSIFCYGMPGFCIACGSEVEGVEPDARNYECRRCGRLAVYGAEEILLSFC